MKCSVLYGAEEIFYLPIEQKEKIDRRNVEVFIVEDILLKKNIENYI